MCVRLRVNAKNMEDELKNLDNDQEEADEDKDDDYEEYINSRERHDGTQTSTKCALDFLERDTPKPDSNDALYKDGLSSINQGWWTTTCREEHRSILHIRQRFETSNYRRVRNRHWALLASGTEERLMRLMMTMRR